MYRQSVNASRALLRNGLVARPIPAPASIVVARRSLHVSPIARDGDSKDSDSPSMRTGPDGRYMSQGHAVDKAKKGGPGGGGNDIQSKAVRRAGKAMGDSHTGGSGEGEMHDTARQGGIASEHKSTEGDGAMADHRGGQPGGKDGGGSMGKSESAAGGSYTDGIKNALGMGGGKMPAEKRKMHTSAIARNDSSPQGSRQPKESSLQGDQNEHLKHKNPSEADKGKGNASEDPSLPSKNKSATSPGKAKHFSTSAVASAEKYVEALDGEPRKSGYHAPPEALPPNLDSAYNTSETQRPNPGLKPSHEAYSSTADAPPNQALRQAALDGTLPDKNPQPSGEVGKKGNKEAWKDRGV